VGRRTVFVARRNGVRLGAECFPQTSSRRCSDAGQSPGIETPSIKEDRVPARRKSMRKVKEVLRLRFELGLGQRQIARSCGMGLGTVHEYLERAVAAGIGWPLPEGLGEEELEAKLFGNQPVQATAVRQRSQPDWNTIHQQLQQHRHLTLQLVWEEYRQANPDGYRYSWFCERYQHWRLHLDVVLRQEHKAGEKMFVDWAGATIPVYDATTGQAWPASLFVSVLGASSYTYAEATRDQQLEAWIESGQTARTGLCGGYRLSHSAWSGQDGSACSGKRLGLGPQPRKHFRVGSDRRGQELHRIRPGAESLPRRLLGSLFASCRFASRTGPGTGRWKLAPLPGSTGPYRRCRVSLLSAVAELILKDFHAW